VLVASLALGGFPAPAAAQPPPEALRTSGAPRLAEPDEGAGEKRVPGLLPLPADGLSRALTSGRIDEARYALERARVLAAGPGRRDVRARFGDVAPPGPRDATMILRDLLVRLPQLRGAEREAARAILARPTDGASDPQGFGYTVGPAGRANTCSTNVCAHWVTRAANRDAPDLTDADASGVPDWVEQTLDVFEEVWGAVIGGHGYRPPKSDLSSPNHGPNGLLDVYLADLGRSGIYGYCSSDDPNAFSRSYEFWDLSAYCVVDQDFAPSQFPHPSVNGIEALKVTAAHEFFHAVQFAYDAYEDTWLMEGTAVWMEDEVYDDINDLYHYFRWSPLRSPHVPVDLGKPLYHYGAWVFWRFLAEFYAPDGTSDPTIIRRVWRLADGSPSGRDLSSLRAVIRVADGRGYPFRLAFADFGTLNLVPQRFYEEGGRYPKPPLSRRHLLTRWRGELAQKTVRLDHLANRYVRFRPGKGTWRRTRLRIDLDLPPYASGAEATVVVRLRSGALRFFPVQVTGSGAASVRVPFSRVRVRWAILVLTNASTRFRCWIGTQFSCLGEPRDENRPYRYSASVTRP
jgi:hypothetical protein